MVSLALLSQAVHRCDCSAINRGVKTLHFRKRSTIIKMMDVTGVPAEVMPAIWVNGAVKCTPLGGRNLLGTRHAQRLVRVGWDTGIGISDAKMATVFNDVP
jgi:hypothetical protein